MPIFKFNKRNEIKYEFRPPNETNRQYPPRIDDRIWERHKALIQKLHDEGKSRPQIVEVLRNQYSWAWEVTVGQLNRPMKIWNLNKSSQGSPLNEDESSHTISPASSSTTMSTSTLKNHRRSDDSMLGVSPSLNAEELQSEHGRISIDTSYFPQLGPKTIPINCRDQYYAENALIPPSCLVQDIPMSQDVPIKSLTDYAPENTSRDSGKGNGTIHLSQQSQPQSQETMAVLIFATEAKTHTMGRSIRRMAGRINLADTMENITINPPLSSEINPNKDITPALIERTIPAPEAVMHYNQYQPPDQIEPRIQDQPQAYDTIQVPISPHEHFTPMDMDADTKSFKNYAQGVNKAPPSSFPAPSSQQDSATSVYSRESWNFYHVTGIAPSRSGSERSQFDMFIDHHGCRARQCDRKRYQSRERFYDAEAQAPATSGGSRDDDDGGGGHHEPMDEDVGPDPESTNGAADEPVHWVMEGIQKVELRENQQCASPFQRRVTVR